MNKEIWGWNSSLQDAYDKDKNRGLLPGRIVREVRHQYTLEGESGPIRGEVSGAFQYRAGGRADYPVIGDWVLYRPVSDEKGLIEDIMERKSRFSRKMAGDRTEEQILASNIDIIYLVFGINGGRNFTSGGLERYMTLAWESGAAPVIILNKADLCSEEDREKACLTAESTAPGVEVHLLSAVTGEGIPQLTASLPSGTTIALTGPSGVGKSTIINALAGESLQKTTPQREGDLRGRHTTTNKEMFRMPSGIILIDTPGLKEVQLWADDDSLSEAFQDITALSEECRFKDCSHKGEPGCAVQAALSTGELDYRRYNNYLDLEGELKYLKTRQDSNAARQEREKWKKIAKLQRAIKTAKKY